MRNDAPPVSLSESVVAFLRRYPPFDGMEREALDFMALRCGVGYYAKGAKILAPEDGEPGFFYVIRNGLVQFGATDGLSVDSTLGPGESFSVEALLERSAPAAAYVSAGDTFCYQLEAAHFRELIARSGRFREFSTRYLGSLLLESRRLLKMHHASLAVEEQAMGRSLRSLMARPLVACSPDTPIGTALATMRDAKVGSIIVTRAEDAPVGILTRYDVLDRITLARASLDAPISTVMTPSPHALPAEASAYDAVMLIAQRGVRHLPVTDGGKVIGVITERELFALQRVSVRSIHRTIANAASTVQLRQAASDIRSLARALIREGIAAEPLVLLISTLNDALTRRIIDLEQARHGLDGIPWNWLGFGSEGRYEQTISTDQDNGIVFVAPEGKTEEVRGRLLPFADAVNEGLDGCRYPLCKGNVMARNPHWCRSLDEWRSQFDAWLDNTGAEALLNALIFLDFRSISARDEQAQALRAHVTARVARAPRFLRQIAEEALKITPPLGVLGDFVTTKTEDGRQLLDLKLSAARLFVDCARVIGLAAGVTHTSTAERLRQGGTKIRMSADEVSSAVEAFFFVQMLRLRHQVSGTAEEGHLADNRIDPRQLNEVDRRMLKECLRQARKLQQRLALDYQL